jgi:hypothetical protein
MFCPPTPLFFCGNHLRKSKIFSLEAKQISPVDQVYKLRLCVFAGSLEKLALAVYISNMV